MAEIASMSKVIVVTSGKGGVGKTTSTAAPGAALSVDERRAAQRVRPARAAGAARSRRRTRHGRLNPLAFRPAGG